MTAPLKTSFDDASPEREREKEEATQRHRERLSFFIPHLDTLQKPREDGSRVFTCKHAADGYGFYIKVCYKDQRDLDFTVYGEPSGNMRVYRHDVTELYHSDQHEIDLSRLKVMNIKTNDEVLGELSRWIIQVATPDEIMSLSDPPSLRLPRADAKYKI